MICSRHALWWLAWAALLPQLSGCATHRIASSADSELTAATTAAQLAFANDRIELALQLYGGALARARALDDAAAIADAAYNLAACLIELGQYSPALVQLDEAEAEAKRAGRPIVDVLLLRATVAHLQIKPTLAMALADQILSQNPPPSNTERAQAYLVKAEASCDAGDAAGAENALRGLNAATISSPVLRARLISAIASTRRLEKDWKAAASEFDRAADAARVAHRYPLMGRDLADAGRAYQAGGNHGMAADRFYRSARSAYGLGNATDALKLLAACEAAANSAGASALAQRAKSLSAEIIGSARAK
jgi:tetratricopeptide (TPR) repeat protein